MSIFSAKITPIQCRDTALALIFLALLVWLFTSNAGFAYAGMGIALLPDFLVQDDLAQGRLIRALPISVRNPRAYYLVHAKGAERRTKIAAFRDWLLEEAAPYRADT